MASASGQSNLAVGEGFEPPRCS